MRKFINESILSRGSCNFLRSTDGEKSVRGERKSFKGGCILHPEKKAQLQVKKALPLVARLSKMALLFQNDPSS